MKVFEIIYVRSRFSPDEIECDNYNIRSLNHEIYLQQMKKSTLPQFDDKRCNINETESKSWN